MFIRVSHKSRLPSILISRFLRLREGITSILKCSSHDTSENRFSEYLSLFISRRVEFSLASSDYFAFSCSVRKSKSTRDACRSTYKKISLKESLFSTTSVTRRRIILFPFVKNFVDRFLAWKLDKQISAR